MSDEAILALDAVSKRFGDTVTADGISLSFGRGAFFTLLGPSGSGKSTILRMIAGLEAPDSGRILFEGRDITAVPPWRRGFGMVFQQYANFPHMPVAGNVAYGLRRHRLSRDETALRVEELLDLVGLRGFQDRRVTQLSGGEQQRVAIARALAPRPQVLLLDEPLSALDEKIRREMQEELRRIQRTTATTFIYVTHDQEEALTMSDRIAVLNGGRSVQCDAPEPIFRRPRTRFVARFFRGCNVLEGERGRTASELGLAGTYFDMGGPVAGGHGAGGARDDVRVGLAIRGEDIRVGEQVQGAAIILPALLEASIYRGLYTDHRLRLADGQTLSAMTASPVVVRPGSKLEIGINAADIVVLEED